MTIVDPLAERYAEQYSSPEDALLQQVAAYTVANHPHHHMMSGHLQGKLLEMVSYMIRPRRILEIGTFTGYSALCLAKGLREDGELHTIELREEDARTARRFFDQSPFSTQIILHTGNALEIVESLKESWDLVFIDADKTAYIQYFTSVMPQLRKNGFILADNIFFHGEILKEEVKGKSAKAIQAFNEFIRQRADVDKTIISLRDGLYLMRKI